MEYFDVLTKDRCYTGKVYPRGTKLNKDEFNAGVEIYITCNNLLLLSQRCKKKSHPLLWEVQGGCIISKDTSLKTIYKEVKEEIGVNLPTEPTYLSTELYKQQFVDIYTINLPEKITSFTLQAEEVSNIKWVDESEFITMQKNNEIVPSVVARFNLIKDKLNLDWKI